MRGALIVREKFSDLYYVISYARGNGNSYLSQCSVVFPWRREVFVVCLSHTAMSRSFTTIPSLTRLSTCSTWNGL